MPDERPLGAQHVAQTGPPKRVSVTFRGAGRHTALQSPREKARGGPGPRPRGSARCGEAAPRTHRRVSARSGQTGSWPRLPARSRRGPCGCWQPGSRWAEGPNAGSRRACSPGGGVLLANQRASRRSCTWCGGAAGGCPQPGAPGSGGLTLAAAAFQRAPLAEVHRPRPRSTEARLASGPGSWGVIVRPRPCSAAPAPGTQHSSPDRGQCKTQSRGAQQGSVQ